MKRTILLLAFLLTMTVGRAGNINYRDTVAKTIAVVNDYWQAHHSADSPAFWNWAAYHTGNMEAYRLLGCQRWLDYSEQWADHNAWAGPPRRTPHDGPTANTARTSSTCSSPTGRFASRPT